MKETDGLKLKVLEGSDPVDYAVLNENFAKVEEGIGDAEQRMSQALGSDGVNARMLVGSYTGTGQGAVTLTFEVKPLMVIIGGGSDVLVFFYGQPLSSYDARLVGIFQTVWAETDEGWTMSWSRGDSSAAAQHNAQDTEYPYIAFLAVE